MFGKSKELFRSGALERASSPENLDQLLRVAGPKDWIPLFVFGALLLAALAWSVKGSVPTIVSGRGILIYPRRVSELQSPAAGRIETFAIHTGDRIHAGDVIGKLDQTDIRRRIEEDRALLLDLQNQDRTKDTLQQERVRLQRQQTNLESVFARTQAQSLQKTLRDAETMAPTLKTRLERLRQARDAGLAPAISAELVEAEQAVLNNEARIADAEARLKELDLATKRAEGLEAELAGNNFDLSAARRNQIQDLLTRIRLNEVQLERNGAIVSALGGRILEVVVVPGQVLAPGARVATIEADDASTELMGMIYFPIGDGKKIQPGMPIQITPDTVERQRFGGITGHVQAVSALPVTREGSKALLGNEEIVRGLMPNGAYIEVTATLDRDASTASGYRWSSSGGPAVEITSGLTHSARVTVEQRAPVTYVLPFLREWSGIY